MPLLKQRKKTWKALTIICHPKKSSTLKYLEEVRFKKLRQTYFKLKSKSKFSLKSKSKV